MAANGKAQYYKLVNQETDSDGEAAFEKAKVVPSPQLGDGAYPEKQDRTSRDIRDFRWTKRATYMFCTAICGLVLLAVLVLVALGPTLNNRPDPIVTVDTCDSTACLTLAGHVARMANFSADPCNNAWQYACGGYLANTILKDYIARLSFYSAGSAKTLQQIGQVLSKVNVSSTPQTFETKAAHLYKTCLSVTHANQLGLEPLLKFFNTVGGWNGTRWTSTKAGLTDTLASIQSISLIDLEDRNGLSPLMQLISTKDDKSNVNIFKIYQSGLGTQSRSVYLSNSTSLVKVAAAYRQFMNDFADLLSNDTAAQEQYRADLAAVYDFETQLANATIPDENLMDPFVSYNKRTLDNISALVPEIDWQSLLKQVFPMSAGSVQGGTPILVEAPVYLSGLSGLLRTTPRQTLSNYLLWQVVRSTAPLLSQPLRDAYFRYKKALKGVEAEPRSQYCLMVTDKSMPLAVGRVYINNILQQPVINKATEYLTELFAAFKANLPSVAWMDDKTKSIAAGKVDGILYQVGYPAAYASNTAVNNLYSSLNLTGSLFDDVLAAWRLETKRLQQDSVPGTVGNRKEWGMRPTQVNAFYEPAMNSIGIPGAILQRPFFDINAPAAFNFGALGTVMGHELSHGFDNRGRLYDSNGTLHDWWSAKSSAGFEKRARCIVQQYNKFKVGEIPVNGNLTLGENIADIGGIEVAFKAYLRYVKKHGGDLPLAGLTDISNDQLFFIAHAQYQCSKATPQELLRRLYTDVHAPLEWRVMGPMMNMPEYAAAFKCGKDSQMNPPTRCSIW